MKFLIIGLGSMGKRRIRNLRALGATDVAGFDLREDRINEVHLTYHIPVFSSYQDAICAFKPDIFIVSVPPQYHMTYAWKAFHLGISCFIEASVVDHQSIQKLSKALIGSSLVIAPSCTMRYFPGPRQVKQIIHSGILGRVLNINYHTGQYLPDWHPWENISDFYVSQRETGGAREILPFELTWLNDIFGCPKPLACVKAKISDLQADIDDIYHCLLSYPSEVLANITIEVLSRPRATRELRIICSDGFLSMTANDNSIYYQRACDPEPINVPLQQGTVENGYINPEEPYINEMRDFISAVKNSSPQIFPNTLEDDSRVLQILERLEAISKLPMSS